MKSHVLHSVQEATDGASVLWHIVQQELAKHGTVVLQHMPYSPYIAPWDIILLAQLKTAVWSLF